MPLLTVLKHQGTIRYRNQLGRIAFGCLAPQAPSLDAPPISIRLGRFLVVIRRGDGRRSAR